MPACDDVQAIFWAERVALSAPFIWLYPVKNLHPITTRSNTVPIMNGCEGSDQRKAVKYSGHHTMVKSDMLRCRQRSRQKSSITDTMHGISQTAATNGRLETINTFWCSLTSNWYAWLSNNCTQQRRPVFPFVWKLGWKFSYRRPLGCGCGDWNSCWSVRLHLIHRQCSW